MLRLCAYIKLIVALMLALASCAYGQATPQDKQQKEVASESKPGGPENKADEPKPKDLQSEVETLKAENAAVRELLRKMAEQQKTLSDVRSPVFFRSYPMPVMPDCHGAARFVFGSNDRAL